MRGRSGARRRLKEILKQPCKLLVIHYSCESLNEASHIQSPKITSIAVKEAAQNQSRSFAPQTVHQRLRIEPDCISDNFNSIEREILRDFFEYAYSRSICHWLHWNMRDSKFGFAHLEHRARTLGLSPIEIHLRNRHDLSAILVDIYGANYSDHPRLFNLMRMNGIESLDFLAGEQEVQAFRRGEFNRLHHSTLRKVGIIYQLAVLSCNNQLVTNRISWIDRLRTLPDQWSKIRGTIDFLIWIGGKTVRLLS